MIAPCPIYSSLISRLELLFVVEHGWTHRKPSCIPFCWGVNFFCAIVPFLLAKQNNTSFLSFLGLGCLGSCFSNTVDGCEIRVTSWKVVNIPSIYVFSRILLVVYRISLAHPQYVSISHSYGQFPPHSLRIQQCAMMAYCWRLMRCVAGSGYWLQFQQMISGVLFPQSSRIISQWNLNLRCVFYFSNWNSNDYG